MTLDDTLGRGIRAPSWVPRSTMSVSWLTTVKRRDEIARVKCQGVERLSQMFRGKRRRHECQGKGNVYTTSRRPRPDLLP
jgi:hypothetical protein